MTQRSLNKAIEKGKLTVSENVTSPSSKILATHDRFGQSRAAIKKLPATAGKKIAGKGSRNREAAVYIIAICPAAYDFPYLIVPVSSSMSTPSFSSFYRISEQFSAPAKAAAIQLRAA